MHCNIKPRSGNKLEPSICKKERIACKGIRLYSARAPKNRVYFLENPYFDLIPVKYQHARAPNLLFILRARAICLRAKNFRNFSSPAPPFLLLLPHRICSHTLKFPSQSTNGNACAAGLTKRRRKKISKAHFALDDHRRIILKFLPLDFAISLYSSPFAYINYPYTYANFELSSWSLSYRVMYSPHRNSSERRYIYPKIPVVKHAPDIHGERGHAYSISCSSQKRYTRTAIPRFNTSSVSRGGMRGAKNKESSLARGKDGDCIIRLYTNSRDVCTRPPSLESGRSQMIARANLNRRQRPKRVCMSMCRCIYTVRIDLP